ncbi:zinc finger protein ZFP2-like isoform X11 [Battus philenor]|uniref:zinc finger protein ZFP2-like isoform X11 n=1 Tax=Battus philenor TaxID=42288 RepID=UPI0035CF5402
MATKTTEWRPGPTVCRCCLAEGCYKDISTEYFWMGKREVYAEMLANTFDLSIAYSQSGGPYSNSRLICEPCISRLRDAADFKRQVVECEKTFLQHLDPSCSADTVVNVSAVVPLEDDREVKIEGVKVERLGSEDELDDSANFNNDDDDDDDLDDQPLTKLASKCSKKDSVDLLDIIDNAKVADKRKSTVKVKATPVKKVKMKKEAKATASKAKPEKKKKDRRNAMKSSIWQMTVAERNNAATFLQFTSVRPFTSMGSTFRCFFCLQYYNEVSALFKHSMIHVVNDRDFILKKLIPKGKRTILVDISDLKCRLCGQPFSDLNTIRQHLEVEHNKQFYASNNGMIEYKMAPKMGLLACHICEKTFHNFALLKSHMNFHVGKVVCEDCGIGFLNQYLLLQHKETHQYSTVKCVHCEKAFFKKAQLKYHVNVVHKGKTGVKIKRCDHCSQTFKERYSLLSHLKKVHGVVKKLSCHVCKTEFTTRRALTEHTTKYHTEKYKCEICGKRFEIESKLKKHMRVHSSEKNFICAICNNAYKCKFSLMKHLRKHNAGE